ncbi:opsin 6, group member b [Erpetoichthys calabaricus]|uniref:opsin 6, group member b n=1 Tax=Erpetoichthys calabaricus TaxID=27687 RepID=UPI002234813D|nr:opsin 6, group member b [Erpetoichthys calabaricus]
MDKVLMDSSAQRLHNGSMSVVSERGETAVGVYLLILGCLSWAGNSVVIVLLFRQRHSLEPHDYLTFNLAISDISISVFGYSRGILEVFNVLRDNGYLITAIWTCQMDGFLILLFGLLSINTLTAISVIRYIKGCQPHQAYRVDTRSVALILGLLWLTALFWAGSPLVGWGSYTGRKYGTCEIDWMKATFSRAYRSYVVGIFFFNFFLPVSIMVFSYVSIIRTVRSSHKSSRGGEVTERQRRIEHNLTRVSFVICVAFLLAWSPYAVISMWSACGLQVPPLTSVVASLFAKTASFYNPFIYMGMSSKFRNDLRKLIHCVGRKSQRGALPPPAIYSTAEEPQPAHDMPPTGVHDGVDPSEKGRRPSRTTSLVIQHHASQSGRL